ncbi:MAG TPA: Clp protease N-terminal domain-containing protein, partial [Candidatus Defluviicoccus seviourii]|nr:Clp protease N-terminal domain-containing protein [Candidatus Defluviicoccus seviourii]
MDFEKLSERTKGFLQAAQGLALRRGHQQLTPVHILQALIEDREGLAAGLIRAAGGDAERVRERAEAELAKLPRIEGGGAGQVYMAPET